MHALAPGGVAAVVAARPPCCSWNWFPWEAHPCDANIAVLRVMLFEFTLKNKGISKHTATDIGSPTAQHRCRWRAAGGEGAVYTKPAW